MKIQKNFEKIGEIPKNVCNCCTGPLPPATGSESEKIRENQKNGEKMEKFYRMFVSVVQVSYHLPLVS